MYSQTGVVKDGARAGRSRRRIRNLVLILVACFLCLLLAKPTYYYAIIPIGDAIRAANYQASPGMHEIITRLNLSDGAERTLAATHPELQDRAAFANSGCNDGHDKSSTLGCYDTERIYVYNSQNDELAGLEESTTAHELLHAIWDRLPSWERDELEPELAHFYQEHRIEMQDYMRFYPPEQFHTELHSVIGTEYPANQMPEHLRLHYQKYFKDFDDIYDFYRSYRDVLNELNERIDELAESIQSQRKLINARELEYLSLANQLNADIASFNYCADLPNCFRSDYEFALQRRALVDRQYELELYYAETERLINAVNGNIAEYNRLAIHQNDLIESINSKEKVEENLTEGEK